MIKDTTIRAEIQFPIFSYEAINIPALQFNVF